jgi:hypothetical protein
VKRVATGCRTSPVKTPPQASHKNMFRVDLSKYHSIDSPMRLTIRVKYIPLTIGCAMQKLKSARGVPAAPPRHDATCFDGQ